MPADRGRINIDMFAARLQPAASRLLTPQSREVDAIVRKASRGGTTLRVEETVGVLARERYERPADISRETIQAQALAVAGGGGGGGGGGYITQIAKILRDGTGTLGSATSTVGATVLSGTVNIPNDGKNYVLLCFADLGYIQTGGSYGAAQLKVGSKASGWIGGGGATWRGWGHMLVSDPMTFTSTPSVTALIEVKSSSGAVNFDGGRIDVFAVPEMGSGGGTWNGGDIILPSRLKNVTLSGRDGTDSQVWAISPTGRMDLEELFATRGLNIGADGIIIARGVGGTTTFLVTGETGDTFVGGTFGVNGAFTTSGSARFGATPTVGAAGSSVAVALVGHSHTSASVTDFTEAAQDAVAAMLAAGSGITLSYNDATNTLAITGTAGGGGLDAEAVRDAIGVALLGVGNITVTVNDAADTITLSTTATVNSTDASLRARASHTGTQTAATISDLAEAVDDRVATLVVAGTGISKTYDDTANTLTLAATGGWAGTRDYPITYVSATAPIEPRVGDFWLETSTPRPPSDDPHASLVVSASAPSGPSLGDLWYQP